MGKDGAGFVNHSTIAAPTCEGSLPIPARFMATICVTAIIFLQQDVRAGSVPEKGSDFQPPPQVSFMLTQGS